jgi:hypothetical protein
MNLRVLSTFGVVSAFLIPTLAPATASAQQADALRFRGGVGLELGANILVGGGASQASGAIGVQGQLGVQITNNWAVYALPILDINFGGGGAGATLGSAVLADYTFSNIPISVSAGPSFGAGFCFGCGGAEGAIYGARLGAHWYPILNRGDDGIRRKALYVGFDLSVLGVAGFSGAAVVQPQVSVGYQAF